MFNTFQWNCFNLVDTCNMALILFLKCDVTKFRITLPLSHNVTLRRPPSAPLTCDVIYGCPLPAPKGTLPVNYASANDWQMAIRRDNVISITLSQVC
jgi:hypothetical protein